MKPPLNKGDRERRGVVYVRNIDGRRHISPATIPGMFDRTITISGLSKTGVAGVPGEAFFHGADGSNLIRFCFAKRDDELEEAVLRIGRLE